MARAVLDWARMKRTLLASLFAFGFAAPAFAAEEAVSAPAPVVAQARPRLVGVILSSAQALLWDDERGEYVIRKVGDDLPAGRIVELDADHVVLERGEQRDVVEISAPPQMKVATRRTRRMPAMIISAVTPGADAPQASGASVPAVDAQQALAAKLAAAVPQSRVEIVGARTAVVAAPVDGASSPVGTDVAPVGGVAPQVGGVAPQVGGVAPQVSGVAAAGDGVAPSGGAAATAYAQQGGVAAPVNGDGLAAAGAPLVVAAPQQPQATPSSAVMTSAAPQSQVIAGQAPVAMNQSPVVVPQSQVAVPQQSPGAVQPSQVPLTQSPADTGVSGNASPTAAMQTVIAPAVSASPPAPSSAGGAAATPQAAQPAAALSATATPAAVSAVMIPRGDLDRALGDFGALSRDVDIAQQPQGGFRLTRIQPGSFAARAGLRADDVILRVDNRAINGVDDAAAAYAWLRVTNHFSVDVMRGGKLVTLRYVIAAEQPPIADAE
jgi:hypothetical protein